MQYNVCCQIRICLLDNATTPLTISEWEENAIQLKQQCIRRLEIWFYSPVYIQSKYKTSDDTYHLNDANLREKK
jgi:hypothetical protein